MARKRAWMLSGVLGLTCLAAGCRNTQKNAIEAAINAAQTAINTVQTEAVKYVPEQLASAQTALQSARDALAKEDYQGALNAAQDAANKAKELAAATAARKEEWTKTWSRLNESMPRSMNEVKRRLDAYSHGARLPSGMDKDMLEAAKPQYEQLKQVWADATADATRGNLRDAIKKATGMQDALAKLMEIVGMKVVKVAPESGPGTQR